MARAGVSTALLFVQSLGGVSHHASEDTRVDHLEMAIAALAALVDGVIGRLAER
jgi:acetylornithine deacetylase/succinyl-diaminopimelate desuccinylase-like protein